ncbi:carbohydrate kinase family protein [Ruania halotolerans]|uniref:carbohydrate kinase family protein n=1 Tax=Ruania halotolerans TaxID=2897773 RepID=UPI001E43FF41|nr:carbohydrate kinase [Ruania halotolerans]UFU07455.1 carbohydrate kinase [Ruania halotolerans]
MTHALVIGEALVDVVHAADGTVTEHPGGSPANVALGLARLGRHTELATWLGKDPRGELVSNHLTSSNVRLVPGSDHAERTSTAQATLAADGSATYTFDLTWRVPEVALDDTVAVVHAGSIGATLTPGGAAVAEIAAAAREHATISYDPNVRPTIMGAAEAVRPQIEHLVSLADVVKVSDEDITWLYPGESDIDAIRRWSRSGPAVVILTRGGTGSVGVTATGVEVEVPAPRVQVVDTVGAGDSYMSGLLDALWSSRLLGAKRRDALTLVDAQTLRSAMEHAGRIAAIVVSRAGANPPTLQELEREAHS